LELMNKSSETTESTTYYKIILDSQLVLRQNRPPSK